MTTQKQIEANSQNAQFSTGPVTEIGKAIVSTNAIKHGIFTKDLILTSDLEQENEEEYRAILNNLLDCLSPCNQMESLLVEKIAVDFWRLRRTIRFETGSIAQAIKKLLREFYSCGAEDNDQIDKEICHEQELIAWNLNYLECLVRGEVTFDQPEWMGKEIKSDIIEDFYMIAKSINLLTKQEREILYNSYSSNFYELRDLLMKYKYSEPQKISAKLIDLYSQQNRRIEEKIQKLTKQKLKNDLSNRLIYMLGMTPEADNTDKVLKYERSL